MRTDCPALKAVRAFAMSPLIDIARDIAGVGRSWQTIRFFDPKHRLALDIAAQP